MGGISVTKNQPSALEDSPASRSFLSRLTFLSRPRTRYITDFHIRPAEPHRKYAAGDHVHGAVVLTVIKPVRITHLTVTLHGFVKVYKSPNATNEPPLNPTQAQHGITGRIRYFGNGHASLFQDEQVLSADGKLEVGRYEFNFELVFPPKGLPSSIDFERGTISYMITATLTRPNGSTPTVSCERKVYLVEQVDIGTIPPPRARTISLEPISKRTRRKRPDRPSGPERGSIVSDVPDTMPSDLELSRGSESIAADDSGPQSPTRVEIPDVTSEFSTESAVSNSTGPGYKASDTAQSSSSASQVGIRTPTPDEKTITASIEMLKGGFLPGDFVPVKVCVHHIKRIKSVHGVIATLFRQGRIDSAPPVSLFKDLSKEEIRRLEREEYFPKSKTGLSGLSLSSAGSCSVFRKDLSQAFGPLIIDPVTLEASVTISVRVPEDAFPTIKGVPGELISFKYQLEVIVDLGGKLASHIHSGQSKSGAASGGATPVSAMRNPYEHGSTVMGQWGTSIIDTDHLRRHKGVISVVIEVPVGTSDSTRQRIRAPLRPKPSREQMQQISAEPPMMAAVYGSDDKGRPRSGDVEDNDYVDDLDGPRSPLAAARYPPNPYYAADTSQPYPAPVYIPPPEVLPEAGLSEKEQIRLAEQRLLPSQPPDATVAGPSSAMPREEDLYDAEEQEFDAAAAASSSVTDGAGPSAPTLDELGPGTGSHPGEDKLERERQRLLEEASAPPNFPDDYDAGAPGPSSPRPATNGTAPEFEPSAPVFTEEGGGYGGSYYYGEAIPRPEGPPLARALTAPVEPLPRYQR